MLATLIWAQIKFAFENDVDDDGIIFYIYTLNSVYFVFLFQNVLHIWHDRCKTCWAVHGKRKWCLVHFGQNKLKIAQWNYRRQYVFFRVRSHSARTHKIHRRNDRMRWGAAGQDRAVVRNCLTTNEELKLNLFYVWLCDEHHHCQLPAAPTPFFLSRARYPNNRWKKIF